MNMRCITPMPTEAGSLGALLENPLAQRARDESHREFGGAVGNVEDRVDLHDIEAGLWPSQSFLSIR